MTDTNQTPIACTLVGDVTYQERVAWIARLNRDGLRSWRQDAGSLELHYARDVRDRVHELVRREAECCAFLTFAVHESPDALCVTITVPERAQDSAEADDLASDSATEAAS